MKLINIAKQVENLNDEEFLTYYIFNITKKLKNSLTSTALCAHYSFSQQKNEIDKTNILMRYKTLLNLK